MTIYRPPVFPIFLSLFSNDKVIDQEFVNEKIIELEVH